MPATNEPFTSLILRFRDLVTATGNTIPLHQKEIDAHGSVWWGWWAKAGEAPAKEALEHIKKTASTGSPFKVFLYDSGRQKLFLADCMSVAFDETERASPDKNRTPAYYAKQKYFAWFEFTRFTPVDEAELKKLTYARRDEFFKDQTSRYGKFYGKQVSSFEELRLQERTIWFVRAFDSNRDRTNEILLFSASTVEPGHFPERIESSKQRALLWLSDLHFSTDGHHAFKTDDSEKEHSLAMAIEKTLAEANAKDLSGILVSGDVTWKAAKEEYALAREFLRRACSSPTTLGNYRVLVCPGNHDLAFSSNPAKKDEPVSVAPDVARTGWSGLYQDLFYLPPNKYCSSGRHFLLAHSFAVDVVALNSSLLEQKPGVFQGHGFVGQPQLDDAAASMRWTEMDGHAPRAFRILMLHHHLMPVTYREDPVEGISYSVSLDAEAIVRWVVEHEVDLVLHGHMHECFFSTVTRPKRKGGQHTFRVAGLGSSGVTKGHRPPGGPANYVGLLSFARSELKLQMLPIRDNHGTSGEANEYVIPIRQQ